MPDRRLVDLRNGRTPSAARAKSRWRDRHAYLVRHHSNQPWWLLERAAGSEDAFDAAVSALAMSDHAEALARLRRPDDPTALIEGTIWRP